MDPTVKNLLLIICTISSYFLASAITGVKISTLLSKLTEVLFSQVAKSASKMSLRNKQEFSLLSEDKRKKSKKYRYFLFMNELVLDLGWKKFGITAEMFSILDFMFSLALSVILYLFIDSFFVCLYLLIIVYVLVIAILFSVSRTGYRMRIRKLIAAENLICGNIIRGVEEAIKLNLDLFDESLRPTFAAFLDRWLLQNYSLPKAMALLNSDLGSHSSALCKRMLLFEEVHRPGMEDMFRFIMQSNIREEERAAIRDYRYSQMNFNYYMCAGILVVFLIMCIISMPEVLMAYTTSWGKMILAIFISMLAMGYVYVQYLQSKAFVYLPEKL